jgi:hypothetical protein
MKLIMRDFKVPEANVKVRKWSNTALNVMFIAATFVLIISTTYQFYNVGGA